MNNPKNVHIVFKVTNYLKSRPENSPPILPIDKVILIFLATHHGHLGIFPNQETLARECEISIRYVRERLQYLMECGLISITRIRRKHHYNLDFLTKELSTIAEPQFPYQETIAEPQFPSQRNHSSAHSGTTVPTNNSIKNPSNKIEREATASLSVNNSEKPKAKAVPMTDDFCPTRKILVKGMEMGLTKDEVDEEVEKFRAIHIEMGKKFPEKEWDGKILVWVMRGAEYKAQRVAKERLKGSGGASGRVQHEVRSTVPWFKGDPMTVFNS